MLGKRAEAVGRVDLPVCFGTPANFRNETLTFEVVGFHGTYHAILGCPCYAWFMAVPNYTYLNLKMTGPNGVITVGPSYEHAYECDVECVEHGEAILESATLVANLDGLANEIPNPRTPRSHRPKGKGVEYQRHPRSQIGSSARRLSPRKHQHLCVESLGYARHT
jgi:hypothetical protein